MQVSAGVAQPDSHDEITNQLDGSHHQHGNVETDCSIACVVGGHIDYGGYNQTDCNIQDVQNTNCGLLDAKLSYTEHSQFQRNSKHVIILIEGSLAQTMMVVSKIESLRCTYIHVWTGRDASGWVGPRRTRRVPARLAPACSVLSRLVWARRNQSEQVCQCCPVQTYVHAPLG